MTEADLIELGFTKQVQDACCDPQIYTFYKVAGIVHLLLHQLVTPLLMIIGQ